MFSSSSFDAGREKKILTALRSDHPVAVLGKPALIALSFGLLSLVLLVDGIDRYPQLHTVLDTVLCLLSGVLALIFEDVGQRLDHPFEKGLARSFAVTFWLHLLHMLVAVEWFGLLGALSETNESWRPATWPSSVYLLPIGFLCSIWLLHRGKQRTRAFTLTLILLALGALSIFFLLPRYTRPGWLGISRPALIFAPVFWAVVAITSWRMRLTDRLLRVVALLGVVLFLAAIPILYSNSPHDGPAMMSHVVMVGGYLMLLLMVVQMAAQDMRERIRAEQELTRLNGRLETRVRDRTTQLEETTAALRKSEARLQFLLSASPAILYSARASKAFSISYMGPNVERFFGHPPDAFSTLTFWKTHVHPDDLPGVEAKLSQLLEGGAAAFEYRFLTTSGVYHWVHDEARLVHHRDGVADEIVGYWVDIHEQKMAEVALRQSEVQYQELFRKIPIPTYRWRKQGEEYVLVGYNDAASQISEGSIADLVGVRLHELYRDVPDVLQDFMTCIGQEGVVRREMSYTLKSSGVRKSLWVHYAFVPPDTVMVHTEDITERKQAELELLDREARLRRAESLAQIGHYAFDGAPDYGNVLWSEGLERIWGFAPHSGEPMSSYVSRIHPDDRERVMGELEKATSEEHGFDIEYRIVHPDGKLVTVHSIAEFTPGGEGRPGRFFGTMIDISQQKQVETQLRDSLQEKETLLREVHHRVKNNLQIISSLLYFQSKQATPENAQVFLEAQNRVRSMTLVHEQLYHATNLNRINFAQYARALAQQVAQMYSPLGRNIRLSIESEAIELPIETALPCGMIFNELLTNVYKYAFPNGHGGTAVVKIARTEAGMCLQVSDDGVGLPDSVNVAKPTSFGLRLIQNLAAQVRGTVRYEQQHGTMATVTVNLPERTIHPS